MALLASSCVSGNYSREDRQSVPGASALQPLVPGQVDLQRCLDELGAPLVVREYEDGADLIWGWTRTKGWGLRGQVPLSGRANGSVSYAKTNLGSQGLTLRFDGDWNLIERRQGPLKDLIDSLRARPTLVDG